MGIRSGIRGWWGGSDTTRHYLNRWSHKPCSICGALRHQGSPSFASASFLHLPAEGKHAERSIPKTKVESKLWINWGTGCPLHAAAGKRLGAFLLSNDSNALKRPRSYYLHERILKLCKHMYDISNLPEFAWKKMKSVFSVTAAYPAEKWSDVCGWNLNLPRRVNHFLLPLCTSPAPLWQVGVVDEFLWVGFH